MTFRKNLLPPSSWQKRSVINIPSLLVPHMRSRISTMSTHHFDCSWCRGSRPAGFAPTAPSCCSCNTEPEMNHFRLEQNDIFLCAVKKFCAFVQHSFVFQMSIYGCVWSVNLTKDLILYAEREIVCICMYVFMYVCTAADVPLPAIAMLA